MDLKDSADLQRFILNGRTETAKRTATTTIFTCHTLFCTFLCRLCTRLQRELPHFTFYGKCEHKAAILLFFFLNADTVFCNSNPEKFAKIWPIERIGIRKKKFAIVRTDLLSDVFASVTVRSYWSSLLSSFKPREAGYESVCYGINNTRPIYCQKELILNFRGTQR